MTIESMGVTPHAIHKLGTSLLVTVDQFPGGSHCTYDYNHEIITTLIETTEAKTCT